MLQNLIEEFKTSTGGALRLIALAAAAGLSLFVTISFLCAAAFIVVLQRYGLIEACLAGAGVFLVVAIIAGIWYFSIKRQQRKRKRPLAPKSALSSAIQDPMVVAAGLQLVRTAGLKRLLPLLAIGGVALGLMSRRSRPPEA